MKKFKIFFFLLVFPISSNLHTTIHQSKWHKKQQYKNLKKISKKQIIRQIYKHFEKNSIDINTPLNVNGDTLLHLAAKIGDLKTIRNLIIKGAHPMIPNKKGISPFNYLFQKGYTLQQLLQIAETLNDINFFNKIIKIKNNFHYKGHI